MLTLKRSAPGQVITVMLQDISKLIRTEAADAMSPTDRKELERLEQQSRPANYTKPLWDRQDILPRPDVQAIDEGDNAPASWDQDSAPSVPAVSAQEPGQHGSPPHIPAQGVAAVPGTGPCTNLGSNEVAHSDSTSPVSQTTTGSITAMEMKIKAKMAEGHQKIAAAKKAAAKAAAKARKAAGDPPTTSSSTAPRNSRPAQSESVTTGCCESPSASLKLRKTSVQNSSMSVLHTGGISEGHHPANHHNDQPVLVPEQQHRSSTTSKLAMPDLGHAQADTKANTHGSALPRHPHAVYPNQATSSIASAVTQLAASTDSKQDGQISTGSSANQLPGSVAVSGPDEGAATEGHSLEGNSASPAASPPAVCDKYAGHEAKHRQTSQGHLDPTSWDVLLCPSSSSSSAAAISGVGSTLSGNIALCAAANTPLPGQKPTQPRAGSQPNVRSLAAAAMAATAERLKVMNSHAFMPSVLQDKTAVETDLKLAMPINSAPPDECIAGESPAVQAEQSVAFAPSTRTLQAPDQCFNDKVPRQADSWQALSLDGSDTATPMDIDATLPRSSMQPRQALFGEAPTAAFGHLYHNSYPAGPCFDGPIASVDAFKFAPVMLLGDDQDESDDQIGSDAMDTDDSL